MKTMMQHALYAVIAALLVSGLCQAVTGATTPAIPGRFPAAVLLLLGFGGLSATLLCSLFARMQREDRHARHEAEQCRAQSAAFLSDQACVEADLLLARVTASVAGNADATGQVVAIQAELTQIQQRWCPDQLTRARLELLRTRIERLGSTLRGEVRAAEPG